MQKEPQNTATDLAPNFRKDIDAGALCHTLHRFKHNLGEFDAALSYMEYSLRLLKKNKDVLEDKNKLKADAQLLGVNLWNNTYEKYENTLYMIALSGVVSAFEDFVSNITNDICNCINKDFSINSFNGEEIKGTKFIKLCTALKKNSLEVKIPSYLNDSFEYYIQCRNNYVHNKKLQSKELNSSFTKVKNKLSDIKQEWPTCDYELILQSCGSISFEDIKLFSAISLKIVQLFVVGLKDKMDVNIYRAFLKENSKISYWSEKRINRYIENKVRTNYGIMN